jgi:hypothetical protein
MRSLLGEEQTSGLTAENVAFDPERLFAAIKCRTAKASLVGIDSLTGQEHSRTIPLAGFASQRSSIQQIRRRED